MKPAHRAISDRCEEVRDFLAALAEPARPPLAGRDVAVVVAHPDDETLGCGAQLRRLKGVSIVVATDGAPRRLDEALAHDFPSSAAYALARLHELSAALALANVASRDIVMLGFADQTAGRRLGDLTRAVYILLGARASRFVLTHAYEGGHPDHDAIAFAAHAAAALLRRRGQPISTVEMPLYRAARGRIAIQNFAPGSGQSAVTLDLDEEERAIKHAMVAAYASQAQTLKPFGLFTECFREAPAYDFTRLPNRGELFYEYFSWGMTGEHWCALARATLRELSLEGAL